MSEPVLEKKPGMLARVKTTPANLLKSFDFGGNSGTSFDARIKKIADQITEKMDQEADDQSRGISEIVRSAVTHFLDQTLFGHLYTQLLVLLNVLSCFQYIYLTYTTVDTNNEASLYFTFYYLEVCVGSLFLLDWFLSLLKAETKINFLCSFHCVVDLMTVIPLFATYNVTCPDFHSVHTARAGMYYVLCGMTTTRILRSLRFGSSFSAISDEVQRYLAEISLKIVVMILFNAAVMQYLEKDQDLPFHTWMYYMLVTIATVGYGDITPDSVLGRFSAMLMIVIAIIMVPQMTNALLEKLARQSVYARASFYPKTSKTTHVLVCGDTRSSSLTEFFQELFHEDHDIVNLYAVVLQPDAPTYEMLQILRDPVYSLSVCYLEGNVLNEKDLKRAKASRAKAIFIMTNKFSSDPDEEDAKIILQQFSIQRYLRLHSEGGKIDSLFCLQLIRPENKRHLVTSADNASTDLVICLNEFKMGVIAKAVIFPGANTLIMNLLTSFADDKEAPPVRTLEGIETLDDDEDSDWLGEYQRGCDWEIYTTELSSTFEGSTFCALSEILYQKLGIVLFALEIEDLKKDKSSTRLLLNPADFVIPPKEDFRIEAFVMAKNKAQSDLTFTKSNSNGEGVIGGNINFSHLTMLANSIGSKLSIHHTVGTGHAKVHHEELGNAHNQVGKEKQAWQMLLRQHEREKTSESRQEEQQKLEDRLLRENYFLRDVHMDLQDAIIRSSLVEEMPFVDNHIIIIGKSLSNLYDLIRPLRARNLGELKHIVIIYPSDFPVAVWQRISIFESIWIIRGSALEEADIRRSGIFKAKQVVVLADASAVENQSKQHISGSAAGMDALVDTDAIFCYQCVRKMNESAHVVVEIVRHTNVGYLDPESGLNSSDIDYKFTPQFASGALFATSLLDTLVCQAFYNTKIIDVVNKLIGAVEIGSKENLDKAAKSVAGKAVGTPGGSSKTNSHSPFHASQQAALHNNNNNQQSQHFSLMDSSSLYQISIPDGLESRTYGSLYRLLSRRKQIPLGILRGVFANTKSGPKSNKMPYVFTNPPKDTELFTCDKVFVLSQAPVGLHRGVIKDDTKEMHMYSNLRTRKKTTEDVIQLIGGLREEIKRIDAKSVNVDARITQLSEDINNKFDLLFRALGNNNNNANNGVPPNMHGSPGGALQRSKTSKGQSNNNLAGMDRLNTSNRNMSIESFAMQQQHLQGSQRGRSGSNDSNGLGNNNNNNNNNRPNSAGARPQLSRTNTNTNSPLPSRPVSAQRGRKGSNSKVAFF